MSDIHLSRELLRATADGRVPGEITRQVAFEHLLARCPTCAGEVSRFAAWKALRGTPEGAAGVASALGLLLDRLPGELAEHEAKRERARRDVARLRKLPPEERLAPVECARTRFRGPVFGALCLEEARAALPGRPRDALAWADAAAFGAYSVPDSEVRTRQAERAVTALQALATAHRGNALRILERFEEAERAIEHAGAILREYGVTDLGAQAEVAALEASLLRARRRFRAAESALQVASLLHAVRDDRPALARTRLTRGTLYHAWGRTEEALAAAEAAEEALNGLAEAAPRLRLAVRHNRADYLCELARFADAREVLEASRDLYARFDDAWTRLRLAWLEGKLAAGLGRDEEAEEHLRAARDGFRAEAPPTTRRSSRSSWPGSTSTRGGARRCGSWRGRWSPPSGGWRSTGRRSPPPASSPAPPPRRR